MIFHLIKF